MKETATASWAGESRFEDWGIGSATGFWVTAGWSLVVFETVTIGGGCVADLDTFGGVLDNDTVDGVLDPATETDDS